MTRDHLACVDHRFLGPIGVLRLSEVGVKVRVFSHLELAQIVDEEALSRPEQAEQCSNCNSLLVQKLLHIQFMFDNPI